VCVGETIPSEYTFGLLVSEEGLSGDHITRA